MRWPTSWSNAAATSSGAAPESSASAPACSIWLAMLTASPRYSAAPRQANNSASRSIVRTVVSIRPATPRALAVEEVAETAYRLNACRVRRIVLDFAAQPADVDVDGTGISCRLVPPDVAQETLAAEHLGGMPQEVHEQVQFAAFQPQF